VGRKANQLTAIQVQNLAKPGKYDDGGGLRLIVTDRGARNWVFRITVDGGPRESGLGGYPDVGPEQARRKAEGERADVRSGADRFASAHGSKRSFPTATPCEGPPLIRSGPHRQRECRARHY
jgi:hypothetical protein